MKNWEQQEKRIKYIEVIVIAIALFFLLFGIICDCLVRRGIIFHVVADINGVSLTLLQIQASVTTLTLAIIALLSGNISESYMGVSISRYFLEIRPFILKQKRVIVAEFICLAASIWAHIMSQYNLVIGLFMASLLLILTSVLEVYTIFKGKKENFAEIELYVNFHMEKGNDYSKVALAFGDDWKGLIACQSTEEFEEYFDIYMKFVLHSVSTELDTKTVNDVSENIVTFLLCDERLSTKIKGIKFINDYYRKICSWINNNQESAVKIKMPFSLIERVAHEYYMALDSLNADVIENIIEWEYLSESVIKISSWIGFENKNETGESVAINSIARSLGSYISKQKKKDNIVNIKRWESLIENRFVYGAYGIPENAVEYYRRALSLRDFNVCYGYLINGHVDIVKNAVFLDGMANTYIIEYPEHLLKIMLIHCFMYYLGFRENTACIDEELQKKIADTLTEKDVVNAVAHFFYRVTEGKSLLSEDIENLMEDILDRFELFPKHSNGKTIIIDGVVKDYFLYVALLIERFSFKKEQLSDVLNTDKYYSYLFKPTYQSTRKRFADIRKIFDTEPGSEEINLKKADDMLSVFESVMKEKYKAHIIQEASQNQIEYETQGIKKETADKIKQVIKEKFDALFKDMDKSFKGVKKYKKVHVFRCTDFTRWLGQDLRNAYSDYPFGNFCNWLMEEFEHTFEVDSIERDSSFENDDAFREFINGNKYGVLIGSQYIFGCEDYDAYREHSDFISEHRCIFVPSSHIGVAAMEGALCIRLDEVMVDIYSPDLDEMRIEKNSETGYISYSPTSGITIDFEENELKEFIHDERKVVDIYFSVTVGIKKKQQTDVCTIIKRKN